MKNKLKIFVLLFILTVIGFNSFGYNFTVFGWVKDSITMVPVANHKIYIYSPDSSIFNPIQVFTNDSGFYTTTINVNQGVTFPLEVSTYDNCNTYHQQSFIVNTQTVQTRADFYICSDSIPVNCSAQFYFYVSNKTVEFYDQSFTAIGNITSWNWQFGDSVSSLEQNPVHTYRQSGMYLVTLEITSRNDSFICTSSVSNYVFIRDSVISPDCYANFHFYNDSNTRFYHFFDSSITLSPITSWNWDFGDNSFSSDSNPSHVYNSDGLYNVTLSISTGTDSMACYDSYSQYIWVGNPVIIENCNANFSFYDSTGLSFLFYDWSQSSSTITSWYWSFGDGSTSNLQNPFHVFADEGEYVVTLTIFSDSCQSSVSRIVYAGENWYPQNCQALFWVDYNESDYHTITFNDFSYFNGQITNYLWNFGDGQTSNAINPVHTYNHDGEYNVTLTINSGSCTSSFSMIVYVSDWTIHEGCKALFFPEFQDSLKVQFFDLSSAPFNSTKEWNFGDNTFSYEQNPLHSYQNEGIYMVTLKVITPDSCYNAFRMEIQVGFQNNKLVSKIIKAYAVHYSQISTDVKTLDNNVLKCTLFPNPVKNQLNIKISEELNEGEVRIISVSGQVFYYEKFTINEIEISTCNLPAGIYIAKIKVDNKISIIKFFK